MELDFEWEEKFQGKIWKQRDGQRKDVKHGIIKK